MIKDNDYFIAALALEKSLCELAVEAAKQATDNKPKNDDEALRLVSHSAGAVEFIVSYILMKLALMNGQITSRESRFIIELSQVLDLRQMMNKYFEIESFEYEDLNECAAEDLPMVLDGICKMVKDCADEFFDNLRTLNKKYPEANYLELCVSKVKCITMLFSYFLGKYESKENLAATKAIQELLIDPYFEKGGN